MGSEELPAIARVYVTDGISIQDRSLIPVAASTSDEACFQEGCAEIREPNDIPVNARS